MTSNIASVITCLVYHLLMLFFMYLLIPNMFIFLKTPPLERKTDALNPLLCLRTVFSFVPRIIIIIMVIFKCYFSGELIALS